MVERYRETGLGLLQHSGGEYVRFSDYADLQRHLAEVRAERDRWEKHATTGDDVLGRTRDKLRAAEAERDRLAAENERLREALDAMLFEYGDKYDSECRLKNSSELDMIAKARAALKGE